MKAIQVIFIFFALMLFTANCFSESEKNDYSHENFMILSDIHLDKDSKYRMQINPSKNNTKNDLDVKTYDEFLKIIKINLAENKIQKPEFILILGDIAGHKRKNKLTILNDELYVFKTLKNDFPSIPKLYVFGNDDSIYKNYGPFEDKSLDSPYQAAVATGWKDGFLSTGFFCSKKPSNFPCLEAEDKKEGYYRVLLQKQLELIALNSVLFSVHRTAISNQDSDNELSWLKKSLENSVQSHRKVLIAMHIPPGKNVYDNNNFWMPKVENTFLKIIDQYHKNILGLLVSHTHMEELKLIVDPKQYKIPVIFTAALSTSHGNAPSLKIFNLKKQDDSWRLGDYTTYQFALNKKGIYLKPLYDFDHYYCRKYDNELDRCLSDITANKMIQYFSAGNSSFHPTENYPGDVNIGLLKKII